MKPTHLYLTHFPEEYPLAQSTFGKIPVVGRLVATLSYALRFKRNPRTGSYLSALCDAPDSGIVLRPIDAVTREEIQGAKSITFVWPDSIGYGWRSHENRIFKDAPHGTKISVINGRTRRFPITRRERNLRYFPRRILERFWVGELFFTVAFLVLTPILWLADALRGRT